MVGTLGIVVVEDFEGYNAFSLPSISTEWFEQRLEMRTVAAVTYESQYMPCDISGEPHC